MNIRSKPLLRLHLYGFVFTPKLMPTLIFLMILPILFSLGFWQLRRADFKQGIQHQYETMLQAQARPIAQFLQDPERAEYARVTATGYYDNRHQLLVDNRIVNHRVGYDVLTPFHLVGSDEVVLVNRGWIPRLADRSQLPTLSPVNGLQTLVGRIKMPPKREFVLAHDEASKKWPRVVQSVNWNRIQVALGQSLYPFMVLLSSRDPHGYWRDWKPQFMKPEKHRAYAFQWFALALTLVIIYAVSNTRRKSDEGTRTKRRTQSP